MASAAELAASPVQQLHIASRPEHVTTRVRLDAEACVQAKGGGAEIARDPRTGHSLAGLLESVQADLARVLYDFSAQVWAFTLTPYQVHPLALSDMIWPLSAAISYQLCLGSESHCNLAVSVRC